MIFLPAVAKWQVVVHLPKWPAVREGAGKLPRGASMKLQAAQKVICFDQWEFQDPKLEVLYHIRYIRPYFGGISPYIALT